MSRERSAQKMRTEILARSGSKDLLKTERSELNRSRSSHSSHSSFTNSKLKRKLSNKKPRRMVLEELKGEKSSLLQNDIARLEAAIDSLRKESQACHSQLARAESVEREALRVRLNELTLEVNDQMQALRKLKKQKKL
jgi:hypothetical protein